MLYFLIAVAALAFCGLLIGWPHLVLRVLCARRRITSLPVTPPAGVHVYRLNLLPRLLGGAQAVTLRSAVCLPDATLAGTRLVHVLTHEYTHTEQAREAGPFYVPVILYQFVAFGTINAPYEVAARAAAHEMVIGG